MTEKIFGQSLEEYTKKTLKNADSMEALIKANKDIALKRSPNSITLSYETSNPRVTEYLKRLYDFLAQGWGYKTTDHMIAVAHMEILARAIHDPLKFGPSALKAIPQIQEKIHLDEKIAAKTKIPGQTKQEIIKRIDGHFKTAPVQKKDPSPPSE